MKGALTCDRESLIMYSEDTLLEIDRARGVHRVQNELEVQAALDELEAGNTVLLTVEGRIVSKARLVEKDDEKVIVEEDLEG